MKNLREFTGGSLDIKRIGAKVGSELKLESESKSKLELGSWLGLGLGLRYRSRMPAFQARLVRGLDINTLNPNPNPSPNPNPNNPFR